MPGWPQISAEILATPRPHEIVRRRYLAAFHEKTGRNVILYYSGWMQGHGAGVSGASIDNSDMNGFMSLLAGWDGKQRSRGLDLVLHTPGGEVAATESLGNYLRAMFGENIRVFVPQMAMSCGTMLACIGKTIVMGKHSSLGPIDPQFGGMSARWVMEDFVRAANAIKADAAYTGLWRPILSNYPPGWFSRCLRAIEWANDVAREWLADGMFKDEGENLAKKVVLGLGVTETPDLSGDGKELAKAHERQFSPIQCRDKIGLKVEMLEEDQNLQDVVLSVHHACMWALARTKAVKIMESHDGSDFVVRNVE